jgi:hypothetical protein
MILRTGSSSWGVAQRPAIIIRTDMPRTVLAVLCQHPASIEKCALTGYLILECGLRRANGSGASSEGPVLDAAGRAGTPPTYPAATQVKGGSAAFGNRGAAALVLCRDKDTGTPPTARQTASNMS